MMKARRFLGLTCTTEDYISVLFDLYMTHKVSIDLVHLKTIKTFRPE